MLERFDCAGSAIREFCHLFDGQVFNEAKVDDLPLVRREFGERLERRPDLWAFFHGRDCGEERRFSPAPPRDVDRALARDGQQPRLNRSAAVTVSPNAGDRLQEHLGGDILREPAVAELGERRPEHEPVVTVVQLGPGRRALAAKRLDGVTFRLE